MAFFDEGRKFVSSSDDKKLMVWEFDTPVPIKYIQDPEMFSMPFLGVHPRGEYIVGQSMDNTIQSFSCGETLKQLRRKVFRGHNNSGYACQAGFSANGKFLISGDGFGNLNIWDWKSTQLVRKIPAHEGGPCMGAIWHPLQSSRVATCGWDGVIKLWD